MTLFYERKAEQDCCRKKLRWRDGALDDCGRVRFRWVRAVPPIGSLTRPAVTAVRAEPVSVLYGWLRDGDWVSCRVHHVGDKEKFLLLEEEMLNFSSAGYMGPKSPNRVDWLVWAMHDLMLTPQRGALCGRGTNWRDPDRGTPAFPTRRSADAESL